MEWTNPENTPDGLGFDAEAAFPLGDSDEQNVQSDSASKKIISICVPIYNTEKYLHRCIESLRGQTYFDLEIILVDDGSTDLSAGICDEYAALDSRISVIHKENGGEASARSAGLAAATGSFVMFIDSDDEYLPNAAELLAGAMETPDTDLAIGGYLERWEDTERLATGHQRRYSASEIARSYLTSGCVYAMPYIATTVNAKLFRLDIIREHRISFDERFVIGNDAVFMCEYLKHVSSVYDVLTAVYIYYKFDPAERVQGMGWYYPDTFFLFAYIADRMIKLIHPDEAEYRQLITKQYKDLLYALVNATVNKERFNNGILPYLDALCSETDLLQDAAKLDLAENYIRKEDGALPIRLISYLITKGRYDELYSLLEVLGKERKMQPYKGEQVRQMVHLAGEQGEDCVRKKDAELICFYDPRADEQLVEQVNELVRAISAGHIQLADCEANKTNLEAQISALTAEIKNHESLTEELKAEVGSHEFRTGELLASFKVSEARVTALTEELGNNAAELEKLRAETEDQKNRIGELTAGMKGYEALIDDLTNEIGVQKAAVEEHLNTIASYANSKSWRITKPFRAIMSFFRD